MSGNNGVKYDAAKLQYDLIDGEWWHSFQQVPISSQRSYVGLLKDVQGGLSQDPSALSYTYIRNYLIQAHAVLVISDDEFAVRTMARECLARVLTLGAIKYDRNNWRKGIELWRCRNAAERHVCAALRGEFFDPEFGTPHISHALCNVMFIEVFRRGSVES